MPVATQAAIKGLTPQQVESLGITLILNNTYHLNLRPGTKVLDEAGGAHKFQGWKRNMLTVSAFTLLLFAMVNNQTSPHLGQRWLPARLS
jgi:tRNA-guanine family transglycosylase